MRPHHLHLRHVAGLVQQVVVHPQRDLAADLQRRLQEQIERARHHALGRILDRHHTAIDRAGLCRAEHLVDTRARHRLDLVAEVREHGLLRERAHRAEIANAQRLLQAPACRHHLAPDGRDALAVQRPRIARLHLADDLQLAVRPECRRRVVLLHLAHGLRHLGAVRQQGEQLAVDGIDLRAQGCQLRRQCGVLVLTRFV